MNKPKTKVSASTEIATPNDSGLYNVITETCMKLRGFIKARLDSDEQLKKDFDKEIDKFLNETGAPYLWCNDDEQKEWCIIIARHFAQWGAIHLNAKKEKKI